MMKMATALIQCMMRSGRGWRRRSLRGERRGGVFEYSDKSDCIFRVQLSRLPSDVLLSDGTFGHVGDRVIDLHFWNEQIPVPPRAGYSLAWACAFNRSIEESLRGLAEFLTRK